MSQGLEPIVDNAPYLSHHHAGLTIEGYSRAAVQSYWRIPELKLGFDLGAQPWDFMGTPTWFLSHTHLDHVAALPVYVARRRMMKMEPPRIYLPEESVEDVMRLLHHHAQARPGPDAMRADRRGAWPGDRAVARARRHGVPHDAHDPSRGLSSSGSGATSSRRSTRACRATRFATCGCRVSR